MKEFAEDKGKFMSVYQAAHLKMSELGHQSAQLQSVGDIVEMKVKFYDVHDL